MEFFSPGHLIVLAIVVAILFFGWKQLPDMSRSLGRSLRIFKTEIKGMGQDDKQRAEAEAPGAPKVLEAAPAPAQVVKNPASRPAAPPPAGPTPAPGRPRPTPTARSAGTAEDG